MFAPDAEVKQVILKISEGFFAFEAKYRYQRMLFIGIKAPRMPCAYFTVDHDSLCRRRAKPCNAGDGNAENQVYAVIDPAKAES